MDLKYIKVGKWYNVPFRVVEIKSGDIHMENGGIKAVCQPSELSEITARQDVLPEHSTVATLSYPERVWNELCDGVFDDDGQKYAADLSKAMRNHIKSITPDSANGTKNTETAPKYDPCREFRKGDRVRLVQCNGRNPFDSFNGIEYPPDETIYTVEGDEYDNGKVELYAMDSCDVFEIHHSNIELVTPIEELEPYYVSTNIDCSTCTIFKRVGEKKLVYSAYYFVHGKGCSNAILGINEAKAAAEAECKMLNAEYRKERDHA